MLLQNAEFHQYVARKFALVASHHSRESGFCPEVFDYLKPRAVVISDKPIQHEMQQMVPDSRNIIAGDCIFVSKQGKRRLVLTTRRGGCIQFEMMENCLFVVTTEYNQPRSLKPAARPQSRLALLHLRRRRRQEDRHHRAVTG